MSFFDDVYNKLFPKKAKGLILHEVLKRNPSYIDQYTLWKDSSKAEQLISEISESLRLKQQGIVKHPEVHHFVSDFSNGIAITYHSEIEPMHFRFLLDYLAEKVKTLEYKTSIKDVMVTDKPEHVETKEKYYMKVRPAFQKPIDQKYGNITLELVILNDQPSFIRLLANAYNDHLYKKPKKFSELAEFLFPKSA